MLESSSLPGQILVGKYRVERLRGEGGHGVVVAAQHLTLGERVAIKLIRSELDNPSRPHGLAVDDKSIYWRVEAPDATCAIRRVAK